MRATASAGASGGSGASARDKRASQPRSSGRARSRGSTAANAPRIHGRVRVIAEAANKPTTSDASLLLEERGVVVIPDIVANAGGVTCSYFEQVQGQSNYYWTREDVLRKVDARMTSAFADVHERAEREQVSLRDGAYLIAVERVAHACRERGWV